MIQKYNSFKDPYRRTHTYKNHNW